MTTAEGDIRNRAWTLAGEYVHRDKSALADLFEELLDQIDALTAAKEDAETAQEKVNEEMDELNDTIEEQKSTIASLEDEVCRQGLTCDDMLK